MTSSSELLSMGLEALGLQISDLERHRLGVYRELLDHWNRTMNLTGLDGEALRLRRLILEPLWVARELQPGGHYLDIGSGNGSPALPWLACTGFESASLVEARVRRATFLEVALRRMGLHGSRVHATHFSAKLALPPPSWVTLQGVRLDARLLSEIRKLNPDARIVWFTRNANLPELPVRRLEIPDTDREVVVFRDSERTGSGTR